MEQVKCEGKKHYLDLLLDESVLQPLKMVEIQYLQLCRQFQ